MTEDKIARETVGEQIHRYFVAWYGPDYVYRAPETFPNQLEVWMLMVASGDLEASGRQMSFLEEMIEKRR